MRSSLIDTAGYVIPFSQLGQELKVHKIILRQWLKECNITDFVKGKYGEKWFKPETLEILRQAKKPPVGWIKMRELEERLHINRDVMRLQVHKQLDQTMARQYWRDMYLSPEAVVRLTVFFTQNIYAERQYKPRKDYNKIQTDKRDKEWEQWAEQPVDESELVTFEGYSLTPEQHVTRLKEKNKRYKYVPQSVIDNFVNWNVH